MKICTVQSTISAVALTAILVTPCVANAELTVNYLFGDKLEAAIGTGVAYGPKYMGSDQSHATFVPVIFVQRGVFFADTSRGIGMQYQTESGLYISQSVYYDQGRVDRKDSWKPGSAALAGMGDVPGSATWHTLIAQQILPSLSVSAEGDFALRDEARRNRVRLGLELNVVDTGQDRVAIGINTFYGNRQHNQSYFGVTQAQADRTQFDMFTASSGLYAYSLEAQWEHALTKNWYGTIQLTGTQYVDQARNSPLVARGSVASGLVTLRYVY